MTTISQSDNHAARFRWNIVGQVVGQGILLVGSILLSRALGPADFGLYAMVSVVGSVASIIVSFGVTHAIVQKQDLNQTQLSSLFWLNLTLGMVFAALFFFGGVLLADFYGQPELITVSKWYSIVPLIAALLNVPAGILTRDLNYRIQAIALILAITISYATAYYFVYLGVLAFVIQAVVYYAILVVINFVSSKWLPTLTFNASSIVSVRKFSVPLLGSQVLDFFFMNLDILLAGKFLGKRESGIYGRANALVMLPSNNIGQLLSKSFFPVFSAHQQQPAVLTDYYLRASKVLVMLILPALVLLAFASEEIILFLLGSDWIESAYLVTLLTGLGMFAAINAFNDTLIISQGKSNLLLKINIADKTLLVIALFIGLKYGIAGLASAKMIAIILAFVPRIYFVLKIIEIKITDFFKRFNKILLALVVMVVLEIIMLRISQSQELFLRLLIRTIPAGLIYCLVLYGLKESAITDLKKLFRFR